MVKRYVFAAALLVWLGAPGWDVPVVARRGAALEDQVALTLRRAGLSGRIESTLEQRLGRPLDERLVEVGRLLFFDNVLGLHEDNSCAGCHSPAFAFGDSQSIAIGVQNNTIVGQDRVGPRNQRKAPPVINTAFYPKLMLNGRFVALSGDPFDNSLGFRFPAPEGTARFPAGDPRFPTLLAAQGHIPPTELVEMAGFNGARRNPIFDPKLHQFDDTLGSRLPRDRDRDGFLNEEIRARVIRKLNDVPDYRARFGTIFGDGGRRLPRITFDMVGLALSEFQTSLTFADAPVDRFARGQHSSMTASQQRGALLFFGKAGCVACHTVGANEMFSDFDNHVLGVPQLAPPFGAGSGNVAFDGPGGDEDFGAEQISGDPADRYRFRTSPLRNVALQPAFFHNGAFTRLEDAIRHHLDARTSALAYEPLAAGVSADLAGARGPIEPVLERLDPLLRAPIRLSTREFADLVAFVRDGLLDPRAIPSRLCSQLPRNVASGLPMALFQGCDEHE